MKKRTKKSRKAIASSPVSIEHHEPKYDLDTLTRAHEIKIDKSRHVAAMKEASKQMEVIRGVIAGPRRQSNEADMDKYAQMRQKTVKGRVKEK